MRKVTVDFEKALRYETLDDYGVDEEKVWFKILDTGNEYYNLIILVHALVEFITTQAKGIPVEDIDKWDLEHPESEDPGEEAEAPYRDQHCFAVGVERMLCAYMGIPWKVYEETWSTALSNRYYDD